MEFDLHNKLSQLFPCFFKTIICSSVLSDQLDFPHVKQDKMNSGSNSLLYQLEWQPWTLWLWCDRQYEFIKQEITIEYLSLL